MDFDILGAVILIMVCLMVAGLIFSKMGAGSREKTLSGIISSAESGEGDFMYMTPEYDTNICEQVRASIGCDKELGVEPSCKLYGGSKYLIRALPTEAGVCLNITEVI